MNKQRTSQNQNADRNESKEDFNQQDPDRVKKDKDGA